MACFVKMGLKPTIIRLENLGHISLLKCVDSIDHRHVFARGDLLECAAQRLHSSDCDCVQMQGVTLAINGRR